MPTTEQATETETILPPPLRQPLRPAHPQAPSQPVLVADQLTGTPVWIYPPEPPAPAPSRIDPMAQRIMAAGAAAPLIGWGATIFFGAMASASTALGYLAICMVCAAYLRATSGAGRGGGVNIRIDNRGR